MPGSNSETKPSSLEENEGKPWTAEDDELLLQLAGLVAWACPATTGSACPLLTPSPGESGGYDVSFGDPWPDARMTPFAFVCILLPLDASPDDLFEDLHLLGDAAARGILGRSPQTHARLARLQDEVQQRYIELVVQEKERSVRHELAITKVPENL